MKLKTLTFFITFFMCVCQKNIAQKKSTDDLTKKNLIGKVKTLKTVTYDAKEEFGELLKDRITSITITEFNDKGFLIKETTFDDKNKITYVEKCTYDLNGNLIEKSQLGLAIFLYKYDSNGKCTQEDECKIDKTLKFRTIYKYSPEGRISESNTYNAKGIIHNKEIFKYDKNGNEIENSWYKKGVLTYSVLKEYDENGNMIREDNLKDLFGERGRIMSYNYNDKKLVIESIYINPDESIRYNLKTEYDNYGNVSKETSVSDDYIQQYNSNYIYSYDEFSNWVIRKEINNGSFDQYIITERELTYFQN